MTDKAFTINDLTERWGCSRNTIYRMIERGELRTFRIGGNQRISAAEVARIENGQTQG